MDALIDANVILRYLLADHMEQARKAEAVIEAGAYTLPEVLAEVVYVLQGVYQLPRAEIAEELTEFVSRVRGSDHAVITSALATYARRNIDFVDSILIARGRLLGDRVVSFDKRLNALL